MITADTYDKDIDALRAKVGRLQTDLSEVIGAIGLISGHGLEDLREETIAGAASLQKQTRQMQSALSRSVAQLESSIEGSLRNQPVLTVVAATAAIALLLSPLLVRR